MESWKKTHNYYLNVSKCKGAKRKKTDRAFNYYNYPRCKVALRLAYHGHNYDGLAKQAETENTVEGEVMEALHRLRLIPETGPESFARCGRTDKGVSALGNVFSLILRSSHVACISSTTQTQASHLPNHTINMLEEEQKEEHQTNELPEVEKKPEQKEGIINHVSSEEEKAEEVTCELANSTNSKQGCELDYSHMLNHILPPTIRIIGYALVNDDFDARFSCKSRTYRYYFCHRGLNLNAMKEAAAYLHGTHNFRNLCKTDVINVCNFTRTVYSVGIYTSELLPEFISYFEINANSFLYHQIRCTMYVLFLIGRNLEEPIVMKSLLERGDEKPMYELAESGPLVLWDCKYDNISWQCSEKARHEIDAELQDIGTALLIRAAGAHAMRCQLSSWYNNTKTTPVLSSSSASSFDDITHSQSTTSTITTTTAATTGMPQESIINKNVIDAWSMTGADWTQDNVHVQMMARRRELLHIERDVFDKASNSSPIITTDDNEQFTMYTPRTYVKLLNRPIERTYTEQVEQLGGKKRARYEVNVAKRAYAEKKLK